MNKILTLLVLILCVNTVFSQEIEITFPSGDLTLSGTLALPDGNGPFSVMILVHGSGPNDRDQTLEIVGGNAACLYPGLLGDTLRTLKGISDRLVNHGFAVLRYDKRSFSHGALLDPKTVSPFDFIRDVNSAVDYVKTRTEINPDCISLIGHSQGASLVPIVANQRTDIKSIICLGTPATRIDTLMAQQFRDLYIICLNDSVTGNAFYTQTLNDFVRIRNGTWNSNTPYLGAYATFWNDWMDIGEGSLSDFNKLNIPFLILHGEEDFNIPLSDYFILQNQVTNSNAYFSLVPGINHNMTTSISPLVSELVFSEMRDFLSRVPCVMVDIEDGIIKKSFEVIPKNGGFIITSEEPLGVIQLYGIGGRVCFETKTNRLQLDISTLGIPTGMYFIKVNTGDVIGVIKVFIH